MIPLRPSALQALAASCLVLGLAAGGCAGADRSEGSDRPVARQAASQTGAAPARTGAARPYKVLTISIDGLSSAAIRKLGGSELPNLHRMIRNGASTLNARSAYEQTETLPNHTSMVTGRRIKKSAGGHGVTWNDDRAGTTVQKAAGEWVSSIFHRVGSHERSSSLFSTKSKFSLFERSWPGAIDKVYIDGSHSTVVTHAISDLVDHHRAFTFLHMSQPDAAGHAYGGMTSEYLQGVRDADRQLGRVLRAIDDHPRRLKQRLVVILTSDHGFAAGQERHDDPTLLANHRAPFIAWGPGIDQANLYRINPHYCSPGTKRVTYGVACKAVRNGDVANLAARQLGIGTVGGSLFGKRHPLYIR